MISPDSPTVELLVEFSVTAVVEDIVASSGVDDWSDADIGEPILVEIVESSIDVAIESPEPVSPSIVVVDATMVADSEEDDVSVEVIVEPALAERFDWSSTLEISSEGIVEPAAVAIIASSVCLEVESPATIFDAEDDTTAPPSDDEILFAEILVLLAELTVA